MHFVLFDNIKLVEGFVDSILVDTQRSRYFKINKSFANVIKRLKASSIEDIYKNGEPHEKVIVEKFVQGLIDQEFGFLTDDKKLFVHNKEVTESLFFYGEIDNSIIEIGRVLLSETKKMIEQLLYLGCRFIEIRCFETLSPKELQELFDLFHESSISSIDLYLLFDSYLIDNEFIQQFCKDNYRLNNVVIYGASFSRKIESKLFNIKYIENSISTSQCGKITSSIFSCNILFYNESQHRNTCLSKKISIDVDGNIKNCPSMAESFGNIRDTTLEEALAKPGFKKYWDITKDKIHVCKDCEFRHICTDCRAYVEDPEDIFSKPLKCGYNPYTGEWSEWSTNPLKQKAIAHYGLREIVDIAGEGV